MKSILALLLKTKYTSSVEVSDEILRNPNPKLGELILNYRMFNEDLVSNNNPGLTNYLIELSHTIKKEHLSKYWETISENNNPGLTEHLIANKEKLHLASIIKNNNPGLANLIRELSPGNSHILSSKIGIDLFANTNPLLASCIIASEYKNWDLISKNPNTGLTKFIIENEINLVLPHLAINSNPGLTDLIIKLHKNMEPEWLVNNTNPLLAPLILSYCRNFDLSASSNPGLTEHILNSKPTYRIYTNTNPLVAGLILDNLMINELDEMADNPNPALTETILKGKHQFGARISNNTNPKLAQLIIENCDLCNIISSPNTGLTDFILKNADQHLCDCILNNTNPSIAPLIIDSKHPNWLQISGNSNTGLTNFIIKNKDKVEQTICSNTNPSLAELIVEVGEDWDELSANNNPGLTGHLLKHEEQLNVYYLAHNNNPELTDLIIELIRKDVYNPYSKILGENKNPRLRSYVKLRPSNPNIAIVDKVRNEKILSTLTGL